MITFQVTEQLDGDILAVTFTIDARSPQELRAKLEPIVGKLDSGRAVLSGPMKGSVALRGNRWVYVKRAA